MKITTKLLDDKVHTLNVLLGRPLTPYKEDRQGNLLKGVHGQVIPCANHFMIDNSYGGVRLDEMAKGGGVNVILDRSAMRSNQCNDQGISNWHQKQLILNYYDNYRNRYFKVH